MSTKRKAKNSILEAVHETAIDLNNIGFIDIHNWLHRHT